MTTDHATAQRLAEAIFDAREPGLFVYAVLDGAADRAVVENVYALAPEFECLYSGELEPDLAECAPYLAPLERGHPFTDWFLAECWGNARAVVLAAPAPIRDVRRHLRSLLIVLDPDGRQLYFRFYDPRVLRVYLPTCTPDELTRVFGPARWILCEDETPDTALRFTAGSAEASALVLRGRMPRSTSDTSTSSAWPIPAHAIDPGAPGTAPAPPLD